MQYDLFDLMKMYYVCITKNGVEKILPIFAYVFIYMIQTCIIMVNLFKDPRTKKMKRV